MSVNRLISTVMLVCLIVQQFVCCCAGACVATCPQNHQTCEVSKSIDSAQCGCGHEHDSPADEETSERSRNSPPAEGGHHHHVCVGTHLFYVSVERFDVSQLVMSHLVGSCWSDIVRDLLPEFEIQTAGNGQGVHPPQSTAVSRSVLCIYQI